MPELTAGAAPADAAKPEETEEDEEPEDPPLQPKLCVRAAPVPEAERRAGCELVIVAAVPDESLVVAAQGAARVAVCAGAD